MPLSARYFEDYAVGDSFDSFARTITETDLVTYLYVSGVRVPMFMDEEYCKLYSPFGTRICPGLMTASIASSMLDDVLGTNILAALSLDQLEFRSPVTPGDTIRCQIHVVEKRGTKKADRGVLVLSVDVLNQASDIPLNFSATVLVRRSPADLGSHTHVRT